MSAKMAANGIRVCLQIRYGGFYPSLIGLACLTVYIGFRTEARALMLACRVM